MGFAKSAEQVAALLKQKRITLGSIFDEILSLNDGVTPYSNVSRENRYIPSGKRSPFMFVGQNPVLPTKEDLEAAAKRKTPLEFFEVSDSVHHENGQLIDKCCEYLGLKRSDVYVTNGVKYPTPDNAEPMMIEAKHHFKKFLFKEIYVVKPEIIFVMGKCAQSWFEKIFEVEFKDVPVRVTLPIKIDDQRIDYEVYLYGIHHPAYVKRNGMNFKMYEDQLVNAKPFIEEIVIDWKYVHLHAHNSFSMKDGIGDVATRVNWAIENRKAALATSNHGNIFDWLQMYNRCKPEKIKPILGCEFYFNRKGLELQECIGGDEPEKVQKRKELKKYTNHFTAFAKNITGFYNMIKINNDAWVNRFYRNPITAPETIVANKEGIICLSGCSGSEANRVITEKYKLLSEKRAEDVEKIITNKISSMKSLFRAKNLEKFYDDEYLDDFDVQWYNDHQDDARFDEVAYTIDVKKFIEESDKELINNADKKAREIIKWWHGVFGQDFYIELMCIDYAPQITINKELILIAKELNIPIVITNDVHYLERGGAKIQQLQMLNDQNKTWDDLANDVNDEIWTIKSDEFYFKTVSEIKESWEKWHKSDVFTEEVFWEGIKNSIAISDKIEDFTIDKGNKLPNMGKNSKAVLAKKITEGLKKRGFSDNKEYKERALFEYDVICKKGFADYILIINDIIMFSKNKWGRNSVGAGRGSAAGSLVNYLIENTDIDPIKHSLLFERFLDLERADVLDVDTDFEPRHRDEIIDYIVQKFGREYVVNIGTFGIARTKVAIQDVGRVFGIPAQETLAVTKMIAEDADEDALFEDAIEKIPELKSYIEKWERVGLDEELKPKSEQVEWKKELQHLRTYISSVRGSARNISQHACGVLVSSDKLMENVALARSRGRLVTGWQEGSDFHELSDLGYYKFDILGLCLEENTEIKTNDGSIRIKDITNEKLISLDINNNEIEIDEEDYLLINTGYKDCIEIELEDGSKVICSYDHKFFKEI